MTLSAFGVKGMSVEECGRWLSETLGGSFSARESEYFGPYLVGRIGSFDMQIVSQTDPEGELQDPNYPDFEVFIYADGDGVPAIVSYAPVGTELSCLQVG